MFDTYDFIDSNKFAGKIVLTSFPGLNDEGKFNDNIFASQLEIFSKNQCSSITSFVEDKEFEKLCDKKLFVEKIYRQNLKWYHLPIQDLERPIRILNSNGRQQKYYLKMNLWRDQMLCFIVEVAKGEQEQLLQYC